MDYEDEGLRSRGSEHSKDDFRGAKEGISCAKTMHLMILFRGFKQYFIIIIIIHV